LYTGGTNCSGYTTWTSSDTETVGATSADKYCMSVPLFSTATFTPTGRYTGGCLSSSDLTAADTYVANLNTFYTSANTLYTSEQTSLDGAGGSKAEGVLMLNKFSTFSTDHVALQGDFTTFYAYVNAFENKSSALKTCSIFRTDMMIFSNTVCFKSIQGFVDQTIWLCLMGPSLCLMAICMFAAIRCPLQKDEDKNQGQSQQGPVQGYPVQGEPVLTDPQFKNVDNNAGNKYNQQGNQYNTGTQLQPIDHKKHGLDI